MGARCSVKDTEKRNRRLSTEAEKEKKRVKARDTRMRGKMNEEMGWEGRC